jgi:DUF2946 family protein
MGIGQNRARLGPRSFWRRLVGAALIFALVVQPLMLAVAAAQAANASAINAAAVDDLSLSQICQHSTDGSPFSPAGQPKHPADDHCAFCFASAFHLLDAPRPAIVRYAGLEIGKIRRSAQPPRLSLFSRYSVACPRGPPLSA